MIKKIFQLAEVLFFFFIMLLGIAVLFILYPPLRTDSSAAWIQAIGSVGAILAAIYVLNRQSKHALDILQQTDRLALARKSAAVLAIVDNADMQIGGWCSLVERCVDKRNVRISIAEDPGLAEVEKAIAAIPLHELGSYSLVEGVQEMAKAFRDLRQLIVRLDGIDNESDLYDTMAGNGARLTAALSAMGHRKVEDGLKELGGPDFYNPEAKDIVPLASVKFPETL